MERAVTPEWSCLELKHCCNQYMTLVGMASEDLSFPVCGNNGDDCYFSQTRRNLANMARALQVMMLSEGNKHKRGPFYREPRLKLRLYRSQRCWGCI